MSRNKGYSGKDAVLPPDVEWVHLEESDGDSSRWPTNTNPNPDQEGHVNYMLPLDLDNAVAVKWRLAIGKALAEMHQYPGYETKTFALRDWPSGYKFYDHHKGQLGGAIRHDVYLVGSEHVARFRSPPEFIPHAFWLMTDKTRDRGNCYCKYCARIPQRNISDALNLTHLRGEVSSQLPSQARVPTKDLLKDSERRRNNRRELQRVFANVRRVPKPVKLPKGPKEFVVPEREKDLRALLGPKHYAPRRWARDGELIWIKLDIPIELGPTPEESILFWPGVIEDIHFKVEVTAKSNDKGKQPESKANRIENDENDPWTLTHMWLYKIRLFVVSKTVLVGDDHILPYQSYAPDGRLLTLLQSVEIDPGPAFDSLEHMADPPSSQPDASSQISEAETALLKDFEAFDPFPSEAPNFNTIAEREAFLRRTAGAYIMAIQVAARVTLFWTPSDEWETKISVPNTNVRRASAFSSASRGELPPDQAHSLGAKLLGVGADQSLYAQKRYQGLWWGPERIWMGEVVRLKLARFQLAPDGAEMIKRPSGPGKTARADSLSTVTSLEDLLRGHGKDQPTASPNEPVKIASNLPLEAPISSSQPADADVEMNNTSESESESNAVLRRSLFMRIDGFFIAQIPSDDGRETHNECRMCGMVYELADEDWESDGDEGFGKPLSSQGKTNNAASVAPPPAAASQVQKDNPATSSHPAAAKQVSTSGAGGARGLASLYSKSAQKGSHTLFPPNPALLSDDVPMDTDPPPPSSSLAESEAPPESTPPDVAAETTLRVENSEQIASMLGEPSSSAANANHTLVTTAIATTTSTIIDSSPTRSQPIPPPTSSPASVAAPPPTSSPTENIEPPDVALSGPVSRVTHTHPLPPAPSYLRFRPIIREGNEVVLPLTLLAGRYYPDLLSSPLLAPRVAAALRDSFASVPAPAGGDGKETETAAPPPGPQTHAPLWALAGLYSGAYNAVDSTTFLPSRVRMVREAERIAWKEITSYWRSLVEQRKATIVID